MNLTVLVICPHLRTGATTGGKQKTRTELARFHLSDFSFLLSLAGRSACKRDCRARRA
jgi:hypothetical protein